MAKPLLVRCPTTGLMAQLLTELGEARPDGHREYRAVECPACRRLHLVNLATGRLLSEENED